MVMNFFKPNFTSIYLMKKYILYFSIFSLIVLSWCWETEQPQSWTWEIISGWMWDSLIQEYSEDMDTPAPEENVETTEKTENVEDTSNTGNNSQQTSEVSTWNTVENGSWENTPAPARKTQSWFWVEECNRIIDFNLCIISKAPIENQEAMKESLQKAVEPWKILANAQLREVCQKTIEKTTFKEVVNHYEALENWCKY